MNGEVPTEGLLQYMRDQGAQRAYRNVAEWLKSDSILDVLGNIETELLVIDARRMAFRNQGPAPRREVPCPKQDLKGLLKKAGAEAKKMMKSRTTRKMRKASSTSPRARRRTR